MNVLSTYAGIYLKEEVQAEGIIRNVGDFARFLETMSFSHAAVINAANIARECQIARKTAKTLLLYRGKRRYRERNILCYPIDQFLSQIHPHFPLSRAVDLDQNNPKNNPGIIAGCD